jgi:hypothetical protein
MDAPVAGKRRNDVMSVDHPQAHPEKVCVVQSKDIHIFLSTPPFMREYRGYSLPRRAKACQEIN